MYRVLVADDEPIERMVVSKKIHKFFPEQFEIVEAINGREAIELFEQKQCQIALLDIEMPGINGLEAAQGIREKNKGCEIIFLTAFDEFNYAKRAIAVRAVEYLLKPVADNELIAGLEEAVRRLEEYKLIQEEEITEVVEQAEDDKETLDNVKRKAVSDYIREYIEAHYQDDLSLQEVANSLHYSEAYFCKLFKQCFDKSFIIYLSELRIEKAKKMLTDVSENVKDISQKVGYRDSNYFTKVFKRNTGETPSEYRVRMLSEQKRK